VVVIFGGLEGATTVIERAFASDCDNESVTRAVKFEVPVLVGVPDIVPPLLNERFAGREPPATFHDSAPLPPVTWRV
jgi:hypothetical protein